MVCDPAGLPKSGRESVGVARPWGGRLGKSIPATWPCPWDTSPERVTPWSTRGCICRKHGPRIRRAWTKRACPQHPEPSARVTRWPWRGWRKTVPRCRIGGWRVTTRVGDRLGCVVDVRPWVSGTCWPCLRTRRGVRWRSSCLRRAAGGAVPRVPGNTSRPGASRLMRQPGTGSRCAMAAKVRWWLRR